MSTRTKWCYLCKRVLILEEHFKECSEGFFTRDGFVNGCKLCTKDHPTFVKDENGRMREVSSDEPKLEYSLQDGAKSASCNS